MRANYFLNIVAIAPEPGSRDRNPVKLMIGQGYAVPALHSIRKYPDSRDWHLAYLIRVGVFAVRMEDSGYKGPHKMSVRKKTACVECRQQKVLHPRVRSSSATNAI
jgi:hypothetical protein